jgi:alkaline phosphatase D
MTDGSPHLAFVDMGGHGYATVRLTGDEMRAEFVCIPRPITRSERPDGGPLRYRVVHTASLWKPGERPVLRQQVLEGHPGYRFEGPCNYFSPPCHYLSLRSHLTWSPCNYF